MSNLRPRNTDRNLAKTAPGKAAGLNLTELSLVISLSSVFGREQEGCAAASAEGKHSGMNSATTDIGGLWAKSPLGLGFAISLI